MFVEIFSCVGIMLVYMIIGLVLCKVKLAEVSHGKTMSAILIYVLGPAMIINSFLNLEYTKENVISIGKFFLVVLAVQLLFFVLLYAIFHKKYRDAKYRIMSAAGVLGNVGFLGMPIVNSIYPLEPIVLCYSSINVMAMNLIVFTAGVFMITNDKKYISLRGAIFNPTTIAIVISLPLFFLGVTLPNAAMDGLGLLGKMVTPVCMMILGMRLSEAKVKDVFGQKFVYFTCLLKLVAFPIFAFIIVSFLPFLDSVAKGCVVALACMPSGAIIQSLAELHECEQEIAANVVLLTTILSVITIPLMTYILI